VQWCLYLKTVIHCELSKKIILDQSLEGWVSMLLISEHELEAVMIQEGKARIWSSGDSRRQGMDWEQWWCQKEGHGLGAVVMQEGRAWIGSSNDSRRQGMDWKQWWCKKAVHGLGAVMIQEGRAWIWSSDDARRQGMDLKQWWCKKTLHGWWFHVAFAIVKSPTEAETQQTWYFEQL
jgi:hypothetical protein